MKEWKEYRLKDFAEIQTGPFGSQLHAADYVKIGTPSIMPTNIGDRLNIITDEIVFVSKEDIVRLKKYTVQETDIVYSRRGDVEKCAYITEKQSGWLCGTGCLRIRFNSKLISPKFCAYYLSTPQAKSLVLNSAVGTTMPNLNTTILGNLPLLIPTIDRQIDIAAVLTSIDNKIDLLHRQNDTLEALAETLFRQWFIIEEDESWEEKKVGDVITVKGGTTPSTTRPEFWDGNVYWTSPRDLSDTDFIYLFDTERKITEEGLAQISSGLLPIGTVLLSSRAPIGYLAITEIPVAINQGYIAVICDKAVSNYFMFLWFKCNMETIINSGNGSTFMEISKSVFKELDFVLPSATKLESFDELIIPMFEKIKSNAKQIQSLTQLRNTLLPKLMSGEVRVESVQEMAVT